MQTLSQQELQQYQAEKWGSIRDFFSKLINRFKMNRFASSAEIGLDLADHLMSQYHKVNLEKLENPTPTGKDVVENKEGDSKTQAESRSLYQSTQNEEDDIEDINGDQVKFFDADSFDIPEDLEDNDNLVNDADFMDAEEWTEEDQTENTELPIQQHNSDNPNSLELQQPKNESSSAEEHLQPMPSPPPATPEITTPALQIDRQEVAAIQPPKPRPVSPKEAMLDTFYSIWVHASKETRGEIRERGWIKLIWNTILQNANIKEWKQIKKPQTYELILGTELSGEKDGVPGRAILMRTMKIIFTEEKIPHSTPEQYRQIIDFPDGGIAQRLGKGLVSTDIHLKRIIVEANSTEKDNPICKIEFIKWGITTAMDFTATQAHEFWATVQWSS